MLCVPHSARSDRRPAAHRGLTALLASSLVALSLVGCASTGTEVHRRPVEEEIDLSGFWNDVDSRRVSERMIETSVSHRWIDDWIDATGDRPTVIVGAVQNRSSEHINTHTFTQDLERAFVLSGDVRVVADRDERGGLREERLDQLRNATIESAKSMGKEIGADLMLIGSIDTIIDAAGREEVRFYQVELELVDLESNEKVWIDQEKIKKYIRNPRYRR